jgi:hypothetical protein
LVRIVAVRTDSANQNPFGQVTGGVLTVHGVLFEIPIPWALFDGHSHRSSQRIDDWALGFDDVAGIDRGDSAEIFFLPLVESPDASEESNLTICGILLEQVQVHRRPCVFKRVGFAIVDGEVGDIANTGWFLKQWKSPQWPAKLTKTIDIV